MLNEIIDQFQQNPGLCLDELSQRLAVEASALEGMLQTLVRKGRLLEIDPGDKACRACPAKGGCVLIGGLGKGYVLVPAQQRDRRTHPAIPPR